QTYMNLSGLALKKVINKYDVRLSKIFIIHDEINLDVGKFNSTIYFHSHPFCFSLQFIFINLF
ncbi:MAG: hypothetical protein Q8763_02930, partial [Candidatus Phytoplasma australasiaticum]|nr:hypothetical protein [Candidatus Phytoplasma australasiaticum]